MSRVRDILLERVGLVPKDALGWLYVARGFYKTKDFHLVIEAVSTCLRNERTAKEAQHLLAFSLMHVGQLDAAAAAFYKSRTMGNQSDWQPLIELCIDNPNLIFKKG
eukprot:TRINITY_DN20089_c0_g1::TRINITY_DN20089_c0_g1_i1::g.15641::m.15641 TRINITY_DN20089_c0_g1::TRINITY_DN20089_c0_g1_i1::g.15641  ORF type:complete len:107 (+),score=0.09,TPR_16/PF13432.1/3.2e+02,TPR_16/PF13432.1/0.0056,Apc3/PF12895.2/0.0071,TPR_14/PF13428.1/4.9e+02,TPR_14/PF13428.1/20,TPR_14/PF13428.1/0.83,TPR_2/PF07719.12/2e+02,TPR_2/PF07719.12/1.8,Fis1_TPR_C/PF14853.1/0.19,TPR_4/PF07721.9/4.8e+02,TPR_4/PF07721.9/1.9 TRINITY_DN20089_c0_g1_i1:145-465(+)